MSTTTDWDRFGLTRLAEQLRQRELRGFARREAEKQAEFEAECEKSDYSCSHYSDVEIELWPENEEVSIFYAERSAYVRN